MAVRRGAAFAIHRLLNSTRFGNHATATAAATIRSEAFCNSRRLPLVFSIPRCYTTEEPRTVEIDFSNDESKRRLVNRMASRRGERNGRGGVNTPYEREAAYINRLERMTNVVEFVEQKHMAPTPELAPAPPGPTTYDRFTAERAPGFLGKPDPIEADLWMKRMKKIFDVLGCTDREKVKFAVYKLEGEADSWWDMQKRAMGVPNEAITWDMFEEAFLEKYFPSSLQDQKEQEFMRLRQGSMTVKEYDAKFTELSRFAPFYVKRKAICTETVHHFRG